MKFIRRTGKGDQYSSRISSKLHEKITHRGVLLVQGDGQAMYHLTKNGVVFMAVVGIGLDKLTDEQINAYFFTSLIEMLEEGESKGNFNKEVVRF